MKKSEFVKEIVDADLNMIGGEDGKTTLKTTYAGTPDQIQKLSSPGHNIYTGFNSFNPALLSKDVDIIEDVVTKLGLDYEIESKEKLDLKKLKEDQPVVAKLLSSLLENIKENSLNEEECFKIIYVLIDKLEIYNFDAYYRKKLNNLLKKNKLQITDGKQSTTK